jgi:hypothetical protein
MAEEMEGMEGVHASGDIFDQEPSKEEKSEMRKAVKTPSEWLKLLCSEWAAENAEIVDEVDAKFLEYKSYLKGVMSPQLLCRLSIPPNKDDDVEEPATIGALVDFWGILGVEDEFDKAYIIAQVERFAHLYHIRGALEEAVDGGFFDPMDAAAAAAAGISVSPQGLVNLPPYVDSTAAAAAAAAAAALNTASDASKIGKLKNQTVEVSKAHKMAKDAEKAFELERRSSMKREQRRNSQERKEYKQRERQEVNIRKASERAARDATREERRQKKIALRQERERFAQAQKEAALLRAAELVRSNRVPIEITRGSAAAKAAANAAVAASGGPVDNEDVPKPKRRSAIVVSTAGDLHQIVTHSKNLWTKYNAIAKEHNQKVNWSTVAKELGIHVKVREKYARMHSRAEQRGFDWEKNAHYRIKDNPHIFLEPTDAEQKARMPPPPPDPASTVLIEGPSSEHHEEQHGHNSDAVAAAAAVVDASGVDSSLEPNDDQTAAAVAATLVADPTASIVEDPSNVEEI